MSFTYLLLNIFTISVPLLRSFEERINYVGKWRFLFPAIAFTGGVFIIWDVIFTHLGIWSFNPNHLLGIDILNLPLEEWLFFLTVPYATLFIYEVLNYFIKKDFLGKIARPLTWVLSIAFLLVAATNFDKTYTFVNFLSCGLFLLLHLVVERENYLGRFYVSFFVALIPFLIVNGILTGSFVNEPVVMYNDAENLGIRLFTIPIEDTVYALLLLLMNTTIYEYLKRTFSKA